MEGTLTSITMPKVSRRIALSLSQARSIIAVVAVRNTVVNSKAAHRKIGKIMAKVQILFTIDIKLLRSSSSYLQYFQQMEALISLK